MTLWLGNEDIQHLMTMRDYIDLLEQGFTELAEGRGVERLPSRTHTYMPEQGAAANRFRCRTIEGGIPKFNAYAVRLNTDVPYERIVGGLRRREKPPATAGSYLGLVLLFDLRNGELLCLLQDAYLNMMCTGANGGIGVRHLSRTDSRIVGVIGSGLQAAGQLRAACAVRSIKQARVFSPTAAHRQDFAQTMARELAIEVQAVDSYQDCIRGADVVITATNSYDRFFRGEWLAPGMHLTAIGGGDRHNKMCEVDGATYVRSSLVAVNSKPQVVYDELADVASAVREHGFSTDRLVDLADIVAGRHDGRTDDRQITFHRHHAGLGLWYAAAAYGLYTRARSSGKGEEIEDRWFLQSMRT